MSMSDSMHVQSNVCFVSIGGPANQFLNKIVWEIILCSSDGGTNSKIKTGYG